jgi:hypothetical protein
MEGVQFSFADGTEDNRKRHGGQKRRGKQAWEQARAADQSNRTKSLETPRGRIWRGGNEFDTGSLKVLGPQI